MAVERGFQFQAEIQIIGFFLLRVIKLLSTWELNCTAMVINGLSILVYVYW